MPRLIFVLELIGTIAFAVSGAVLAVRKGMDVFGVTILGLTTAVGGGAIRDLLLGNTPPLTFLRPTTHNFASQDELCPKNRRTPTYDTQNAPKSHLF